MTEELCKIIGIIIVIGFVIFLAVKSLKLQLSMIEGFVGDSSAQPDVQDSLNGIAGNASQYANNIKMQVIKMQDTLLIPKYRKDYENAIIHMDDYISFLMLQTILNMDTDPNSSAKNLKLLESLNTLNKSKVSLDTIMKFVDKTK